MKRLLLFLSSVFAAIGLPLLAAPLDSTFHYQGSLSENGQPANGAYDLRLALYESVEGGAPVGQTLTNANVAVTEGLIRTTMDFGAEAFNGTALWLEIGVRSGGSEDPFVTLSPRQPLLAAPYAVHALSAETVPDGSLTGETLAEGQVVKSLNGLTDHVALVAGTNITVTQQGTSLTVSAAVAEGPQGPKGDQGDMGPVGPQGPQGEPGDSLWNLNGADVSYIGGSMGLGTSSPAALIHAHGPPVANRGQLSLSSPPGQDAILSLYDADVFTAYLWYDPTDQDLRLQNVRTGDLNLNPYGGNVGIGANNPNAKLQVAGAVAIGNTTDATPPAGTIRWTGTDFEGYSGSEWTSLTGRGAWSLTGNAGTDASVNFLGTTDAEPLELRTSGHRALRLETTQTNSDPYVVRPTPLGDDLVNVVVGHFSSLVEPGNAGAVIGGGVGNSIFLNPVYQLGIAVTPSDFDVIGGGEGNQLCGSHNVIGGGRGNAIGISQIDGGSKPDANVISGGEGNVAAGEGNAIAGGSGNAIERGYRCVIGGGAGNTIDHWDSYSLSEGGVIGGGIGNFLNAQYGGTIAGGVRNTMFPPVGATIGGGEANTMSSEHGVICGGLNNKVYGQSAVVVGGSHNLVEGDSNHGVILGGVSNVVSGIHAAAAGRRAKALHDGAFVWGNSTDDNVESSNTNEFTARASGGVRFFTSADLSSGVTLAPGDGSWASVSDRNAKCDFEPIDGVAVLEKVAALPLSTWSYRAQDASIRHIGPMAQDFQAAFGVGADDKRITSVDADGVAVAAIQGLNQKLTAKETEIADLRQQNTELESRLAALEETVAGLSSHGMATR